MISLIRSIASCGIWMRSSACAAVDAGSSSTGFGGGALFAPILGAITGCAGSAGRLITFQRMPARMLYGPVVTSKPCARPAAATPANHGVKSSSAKKNGSGAIVSKAR